MSLNSLPMRKDPVFSAGGTYPLVVEKNICFHKEATERISEILTRPLSKNKSPKTLHLLDLACGGQPIIPAEIMRRFSDHSFIYTGVDINLDQIAACKKFSFSKNVKTDVMEGNVWDLGPLPLTPPYDIIFMVLNSHHAVPEELLTLANTIYKFLKPGGIFLNHDLFRPAPYPYLRRPEAGQTNNTQHPWREEWLSLHKKFLVANGQTPQDAEQGIHHMRERDWPISQEEMCAILKQAGFKTKMFHYPNIDYPLPDFFGLVEGVKP